MSQISEYTLPTNKEDRDRIKSRIEEMSAQQQMIQDRRDCIKEIKDDLKDTYGMPASLIGKLVKAVDDDKYVEMTTENSVFEVVRETILGDGGLPDDNGDEDSE